MSNHCTCLEIWGHKVQPRPQSKWKGVGGVSPRRNQMLWCWVLPERPRPTHRTVGTHPAEGALWPFQEHLKRTFLFFRLFSESDDPPPPFLRLVFVPFVTWPCTSPTQKTPVSIKGCPWPVMCTERRIENSSNTYCACQHVYTGTGNNHTCK